MKKVSALILCTFIIISIFCSCKKAVPEDLSYMVSFGCESENVDWSYELKDEGIVTVTQELQTGEDGRSMVFVLESVGEGETEITFISTDTSSGEVLRKVLYSVSVDSSFEITAKLLKDELPEPLTQPAVSVGNKQEAEELVSSSLIKDNPDFEGNLVFKTEKGGNGKFIVRVFRIVPGKNGKTILKYYLTCIVSPDGSIKQKHESDIQDKVLNTK